MVKQQKSKAELEMKMCHDANLDAKGDGLHDKDTVREDSSNFLNTREILNWIPNVPVFIQQLELAYREDGERMSVRAKEHRWKRIKEEVERSWEMGKEVKESTEEE